jgi:hypothetical protein
MRHGRVQGLGGSWPVDFGIKAYRILKMLFFQD